MEHSRTELQRRCYLVISSDITMSSRRPTQRGEPPTAALFTRIPKEQAEQLDQAATLLRRPKQEIVAELIARHLDVGLSGAPSGGVGPEAGPMVGQHGFRAAHEDDVMTVEQLADLLRIPEEEVQAAAEAGQLPGRKIGAQWRFSRQAVLDWLGTSAREAAGGEDQ